MTEYIFWGRGVSHFLKGSKFSYLMCGIVWWQIYFKKKKTGGISFNSTLPLTRVDEKLCYQILHEYKIHNAEVTSPTPNPKQNCIDLALSLYVYIYISIDESRIQICSGYPFTLNDFLLTKRWACMEVTVFFARANMIPHSVFIH